MLPDLETLAFFYIIAWVFMFWSNRADTFTPSIVCPDVADTVIAAPSVLRPGVCGDAQKIQVHGTL